MEQENYRGQDEEQRRDQNTEKEKRGLLNFDKKMEKQEREEKRKEKRGMKILKLLQGGVDSVEERYRPRACRIIEEILERVTSNPIELKKLCLGNKNQEVCRKEIKDFFDKTWETLKFTDAVAMSDEEQEDPLCTPIDPSVSVAAFNHEMEDSTEHYEDPLDRSWFMVEDEKAEKQPETPFFTPICGVEPRRHMIGDFFHLNRNDHELGNDTIFQTPLDVCDSEHIHIPSRNAPSLLDSGRNASAGNGATSFATNVLGAHSDCAGAESCRDSFSFTKTAPRTNDNPGLDHATSQPPKPKDGNREINNLQDPMVPANILHSFLVARIQEEDENRDKRMKEAAGKAVQVPRHGSGTASTSTNRAQTVPNINLLPLGLCLQTPTAQDSQNMPAPESSLPSPTDSEPEQSSRKKPVSGSKAAEISNLQAKSNQTFTICHGRATPAVSGRPTAVSETSKQNKQVGTSSKTKGSEPKSRAALDYSSEGSRGSSPDGNASDGKRVLKKKKRCISTSSSSSGFSDQAKNGNQSGNPNPADTSEDENSSVTIKRTPTPPCRVQNRNERKHVSADSDSSDNEKSSIGSSRASTSPLLGENQNQRQPSADQAPLLVPARRPARHQEPRTPNVNPNVPPHQGPYTEEETRNIFEFMIRENLLMYMLGTLVPRVIYATNVVSRPWKSIQNHISKTFQNEARLRRLRRIIGPEAYQQVMEAKRVNRRFQHANLINKDDLEQRFNVVL